MTRRFRPLLAVLAIAIVAIPINVGAASPATASPATASPATASPAPAAFGDETFGCRVAPGTDLTWRPFCLNNRPASSYVAGFAVLNTSGSYTFSWDINGNHGGIFSGCTSTSSGCAITMPNSDGSVTVTVTFSQSGQSRTKSATAVIRRYCGQVLC